MANETTIPTAKNQLKPRDWERARRLFLDALKKTGSKSAAAAHAGHSPQLFRRYRQWLPDFDEEVSLLEAAAFAEIETAARSRVIHGVKKYVVNRGELVRNPDWKPGMPKSEKYLCEYQFPEGLTQMMMRSLDPNKEYGRDKGDAEEEPDFTPDKTAPDEPGPKNPLL